jgi:YD repeat-containing protein
LNRTYSYNAAGELTGIDYSDATPDVTFVYDRRGRQTGITQGGASTSQLFNDAGQLLSQTARVPPLENQGLLPGAGPWVFPGGRCPNFYL